MRKPPSINDLYKYPVTAIVILLCLAFSILWWSDQDLGWAKMSPLLLEGQIWRPITSLFLHVDFIHLAFNLYWFWVFGTLFEPALGRRWFVGVVLILGFGSSLAEFAFSTGGVGLSGVGYGLFGMAWVLSRYDDRFKNAVDGPTVFTFLVWFVFCVFVTYKGLVNIGNVAHGAGLALGLVLGRRFAPGTRPLVPNLLLAGLLISSLLGAFVRDRFVSSETLAREQAEIGYDELSAKRYLAARKRLQRSLDLDDRDADTWFNLGIAQDQLGNIESAVEAFQNSYDRKENKQTRETLYSALVSAATIEQQASRHLGAAPLLRRALALDGKDAQIWYNLGYSLWNMEQKEEALKAFEEVRKREPLNPTFQPAFVILREARKE